MKIYLNWLQQFVDFDLVDKKSLDHVVVGYVKSVKKHPGADSLNLAQVDIGNETVQIVCGGVNLVEKRHVPIALPGAILPGNFAIQKSKIRGEESNGMICANEELGLGSNPPRSIWLLDAKKKWTPGMPLLEALGFDKAVSAQEVADQFTLHTAEVEALIPQDQYLHHVVTGKLVSFEKMEGSDKLHIGQFDIGWKTVQIVFGSVYQIHIGEILPLALPGAKLPNVEIKVGEFKGIKSEGMVCGDDEIGIQNSTEGITRFPSKTPLGTPIAEVLGLTGISIDVDNKSLTHRPDLWSHYGFARELSAILKKPLKKIAPLLTLKEGKPTQKLHIKIHDAAICPRFSGCILTGVKVQESAQWVKSRLQAAGIRPINNVVDVTNYVMVELGQPMHAYDRQIVGNDTLDVRYAKKGESIETIDHKQRPLHTADPVVANAKGVLGVAGIMGGAHSEIHDGTTEVILEAANWDPKILRKSSTHHGLRSEASQRFEKGLDPSMTEIALRRAVSILQENCPTATLVTPFTTIGDWKPKTIKITLDPAVVRNKIGVEIPTTEMVRILKALEFTVTPKGETYEVTVPSHRATGDVDRPEDLVEEIARLYGYNTIQEKMPELPIRLPMENEERFHKHDARRILAYQMGFTEMMNYSFYSEDEINVCGLENMRHIRVKNALSVEQTHMRVSLIPGILKNIVKNGHERSHLNLFEFGRTYKEVGEFMPLEEKNVVAAVAAPQKSDEVFYAIKGALESFLEKFRTPNVILRETHTPPSYAHPKKAIEVVVRGEVIGYAYTLHPAVAQALELKHDVGCFELNFTKLAAHGRATPKFEELPKFPSMPFDVSLLIDRKKSIADVERAIQKGDPHGLIRRIKLFDVYEGKNIPEDKKSLAFTIELRHDDHTLSDQEFQATQAAVFASVEKIGGQVRRG